MAFARERSHAMRRTILLGIAVLTTQLAAILPTTETADARLRYVYCKATPYCVATCRSYTHPVTCYASVSTGRCVKYCR
jgi:hypothetical protein